jgi:HEAT repeat protein
MVCGVKWGTRVGLILLACLAMAGSLVLVLPREREPEYQGKKLSEWLRIGFWSNYGTPERRDATKAVREIGTNALPYLSKAIAYERTSITDKEMTLVKALPIPFGMKLALVKRLAEGDNRATRAEFGFTALREVANPVVPELARLMTRTNIDVRRRVFDALSDIGTNSVRPLLILLRDQQNSNRNSAASCLLRICDNPTNRVYMASVVPDFLSCLRDMDDGVIRPAAAALGTLGLQPEVCVPKLGELLQHTNSHVRYVGVMALHSFGQKARPALPILLERLNDVDVWVRESATNAVRRIAPEVLTNAAGK